MIVKVKPHYGNWSQCSHLRLAPTPSSSDTPRGPLRPGEPARGPRRRESMSAPENTQGKGAHRAAALASSARAASLSTALPRGSKQNWRTSGRGHQYCEAAPDTLGPFPSKGRTWCLKQKGGSVRSSGGAWVCGPAGPPRFQPGRHASSEAPPWPLTLLTAVGCTVPQAADTSHKT